MLTDVQITQIAEKLNAKIDLPIAGEKIELMIFKKIVRLIDMTLHEKLPDELYMLINVAGQGFTDDANLDEIKSQLVESLNMVIDVPFIGEAFEKEIFDFVIGLIIEALHKDKKLDDVVEAA